MCSLFTFLITLCHIKHIVYSQQSKQDSATELVITIDADTFEQTIQSNDKVLVEFFAPWCGYCKQFAPEYESAAYMLNNDLSIQNEIGNIILCKLDATDNKNTLISEQYNIEGYPTLKYFQNNNLEQPIEYDMEENGGTADDLVAWLLQKNYASNTLLHSLNDIESFLDYNLIQNDNGLALILYIDKTNTDVIQLIEYVAEIFGDIISIGIVHNKNIINQLKSIEFNNIYIYSTMNRDVRDDINVNDIDIIKYNGDLTDYDSIETFINIESTQFIAELTEENHQMYEELSIPLVWIPIDNIDSISTIKTILKPYAKQYRGELAFIWFDKSDQIELYNYMGFKDNIEFIIQTIEQRKYAFEYDLLGDGMENKLDIFFEEYMNDKIDMYVQSEELLDDELYENNVYVLVGLSIDEFISNENHKEILIYYYSKEYCEICHDFIKQYEEIATAFKNVNEFEIAKINIDINDVFENVNEIPMLILYGKGIGFGDGIVYDIVDEHTLHSLSIVEWIKQNAKSDLNGYDNTVEYTNYVNPQDEEYENEDDDDDLYKGKESKYESITKKIDNKLIIIAVVMGILAFCFGFAVSYKRAKNKAE